MIELPDFAVRGSASITFVDAGFVQRGLTTREYIARKGSHYHISCTYGPFAPDEARVMVRRLISAKQEGLRIPLPLLHSQGGPGNPELNGAVTTGTVIALDGMTPGYVVQEGFFLSLIKSGQHYLHSVAVGGTVNGAGQVTITLAEMLRTDFPDDTEVRLAEPMVEGLVDGDEWQWAMAVDRAVPIQFSIEEAA